MPDRIFLGHTTAVIPASVTRPANATPYVTGDVIASNAIPTNDPVLVFPAVARSNGGSGMIMNCVMVDSANQPTQPSLELWLFKARPLSVNQPADNAPFNPSEADMANLVGVIPLTLARIGDASAAAAGNLMMQSDVVATPFKCAGGDDALYGVVVVRNGYTPVAGEVFIFTLTALQDY